MLSTTAEKELGDSELVSELSVSEAEAMCAHSPSLPPTDDWFLAALSSPPKTVRTSNSNQIR